MCLEELGHRVLSLEQRVHIQRHSLEAAQTELIELTSAHDQRPAILAQAIGVGVDVHQLHLVVGLWRFLTLDRTVATIS